MSQRFYPYAPGPINGQPVLCMKHGCTNVAYWWDAQHGANWCDFHALAEVATSVQVQCDVCLR